MTSRFRANVLANVLGTLWVAAVQIVAAPLVIAKLGTAAYGLVGFFATLGALLAVLDFGLLPTLTRAMARQASGADAPRAADIVRTFEVVFVITGAVMALAVALLAPWIADHWLHASTLETTHIEQGIRWMAVLFAVRWIQGPYAATLQGFQRQALLSAANAALYTVEYGAAVAAVWLVSPSVVAYFAVLAGGALMHALVLRWLTWRLAPLGEDPAPRVVAAALTSGWRFSAGMLGISITATILTQSDKVLLSALVPLEDFGVYSMAQVLAAGLGLIIMPVYNAVYPRLCELVSARDEMQVQSFFRAAANLLNATIAPLALTLILFSRETLFAWCHDAELASRAAPLFALLVAGTLMNGMMFVPYALQLARGQTRIGLTINVFLCLALLPSVYLLATRYGLIGGASAWPAVNLVYLAVGVPITWRRCLGSTDWGRFFGALAIGQAVPLCFLLVMRASLPESTSPMINAFEVAAMGAIALAASLVLTPGARSLLRTLPRHPALT